jgi:hypothetical protein
MDKTLESTVGRSVNGFRETRANRSSISDLTLRIWTARTLFTRIVRNFRNDLFVATGKWIAAHSTLTEAVDIVIRNLADCVLTTQTGTRVSTEVIDAIQVRWAFIVADTFRSTADAVRISSIWRNAST